MKKQEKSLLKQVENVFNKCSKYEDIEEQFGLDYNGILNIIRKYFIIERTLDEYDLKEYLRDSSSEEPNIDDFFDLIRYPRNNKKEEEIEKELGIGFVSIYQAITNGIWYIKGDNFIRSQPSLSCCGTLNQIFFVVDGRRFNLDGLNKTWGLSLGEFMSCLQKSKKNNTTQK